MVHFNQLISQWPSLGPRHCAVAWEDDGSRPLPAGSMGIYIGEEQRRFVIPARFLNFPLISSMLYQYDDETGYTASGGIILHCSVDFFRLVLRLLEKNEAEYKAFTMDELLELSARDGIDECGASSCRDDIASHKFCSVFSPLLQRAN